MSSQPKLVLSLTQTDKIIEIIGWIVLFGTWALTLVNYSELPEIIPTH